MYFADENNSNSIYEFSSKTNSRDPANFPFIHKSQINLITTQEDLLFCNGNILTIFREEGDHISEEIYHFSKIFSSFDSNQFSLAKSTFLEGKNILVTTIGYDFFPPILTSDFVSNNYLLFKQFELDSTFEMPNSILKSPIDLNLSPITIISQKKKLNYLIILCLPILKLTSFIYIKELVSKILNHKTPSLAFFSTLYFHFSIINLCLNNIDSEISINILHSLFPNFSKSIIPFKSYFIKKIHQQINSLKINQNFHNSNNNSMALLQKQKQENHPQIQILLDQKFQIEKQIYEYQNLWEKTRKENEEKKERIEENKEKLKKLLEEKDHLEKIIKLMIKYTEEIQNEVKTEEKRKEQQIHCIDALLLLEPTQNDYQLTKERSQKIHSIISTAKQLENN